MCSICRSIRRRLQSEKGAIASRRYDADGRSPKDASKGKTDWRLLMSVKPITITTIHDATTFDPETHRAEAADQLGLDPGDIHCIECGPDTFERISDAVYTQDGTGTLLSEPVVKYHRKTTWEQRAMPARQPKIEAPPPVLETHAKPKLSRGARWNGVIDGVEGNYISDGKELHHVDIQQGKTLTAVLNAEQEGYRS
jgi:hypothetical protein